jgi:mannose-1-phosphate guanylyltransferase/phosphomannomutase
MPKALLPIAGKPLLENTLELLRHHKITDVVICLGHLGDEIIKHFGNGEKFGLNVHYSQEKDPLGTAGALKHGEPFYEGETILVLHGDILTHLDLNDFISFHLQQNTSASIAIKPRPSTPKYGKVLMIGPKIKEFYTRPTLEGVGLVNTGIYVLEPYVLEMIPVGKRVYLEEEIFPKLAAQGELSGYPFQGPWFDISTSKSYEEAIKRWKKERR